MKAKIEFKELTPTGYETLCNWVVEKSIATPSVELVSKLNELINHYWKKGKIVSYEMNFRPESYEQPCSQRE